jgi:hypothetical protein
METEALWGILGIFGEHALALFTAITQPWQNSALLFVSSTLPFLLPV